MSKELEQIWKNMGLDPSKVKQSINENKVVNNNTNEEEINEISDFYRKAKSSAGAALDSIKSGADYVINSFKLGSKEYKRKRLKNTLIDEFENAEKALNSVYTEISGYKKYINEYSIKIKEKFSAYPQILESYNEIFDLIKKQDQLFNSIYNYDSPSIKTDNTVNDEDVDPEYRKYLDYIAKYKQENGYDQSVKTDNNTVNDTPKNVSGNQTNEPESAVNTNNTSSEENANEPETSNADVSSEENANEPLVNNKPNDQVSGGEQSDTKAKKGRPKVVNETYTKYVYPTKDFFDNNNIIDDDSITDQPDSAVYLIMNVTGNTAELSFNLSDESKKDIFKISFNNYYDDLKYFIKNKLTEEDKKNIVREGIIKEVSPGIAKFKNGNWVITRKIEIETPKTENKSTSKTEKGNNITINDLMDDDDNDDIYDNLLGSSMTGTDTENISDIDDIGDENNLNKNELKVPKESKTAITLSENSKIFNNNSIRLDEGSLVFNDIDIENIDSGKNLPLFIGKSTKTNDKLVIDIIRPNKSYTYNEDDIYIDIKKLIAQIKTNIEKFETDPMIVVSNPDVDTSKIKNIIINDYGILDIDTALDGEDEEMIYTLEKPISITYVV